MREGTPTGIMHSHDDHSIMQPLGQAVGRSVGASEDAGFRAFEFHFIFFTSKSTNEKTHPGILMYFEFLYLSIIIKKILIHISNLSRNEKAV